MFYLIIAVITAILAYQVSADSNTKLIDCIFVGIVWPVLVIVLCIAGAWVTIDSFKKVKEDESKADDATSSSDE